LSHLPKPDDAAGAAAVLSSPDALTLRLRGVHRAASELRRGTPVVLDGVVPMVLLPAETAGARGLTEFAAIAGGPAVLLLAPMRAASVLRGPVASDGTVQAIKLTPALFAPQPLRGLADPTAEQVLPEPPVRAEVPAGAAAALALVKLARLLPAAVAAPTRADVMSHILELDLLSVSEADILAYPLAMAANVARVAEASVPLENAPDARVVAFRAPDSGVEHLAILVGRPEEDETPLVRLHSECFTGDLLGSLRCDCGPQLKGAITRMAEEGSGVLLYLSQEGRGIGLVNKLRAYALQDRGLDTLDANRALGWGGDERNYLVAATMLGELGIHRLRLLTNNPDKVAALSACGVEVMARVPHVFAPNGFNDAYLATKIARLGHLLP
jgi:GTP cyclohydrolase II